MKFPMILVPMVLLAVLPAGPARAEPDALARPAMISARAATSVILAVTRADKRLVAVGERGIVLLSDDNGNTWRQARTPVSVSLTNAHFPSAKLGWAVGHSGVVLASSDAGETWVKQLDGKEAAKLVLAAAKTRGDAGKLAEAERFMADGPDKPFLDVRFADAKNGMIVGAYGLILGTMDGGKTWQSWLERIDNPKGKHLYSISALDADLLISGEQGALFVSHDGGKSFNEVKTPYAGTYFGIVAGSTGQWLAYGLRGNAYCTNDRGHSWQKLDAKAPNTLTAGIRLADGSIVLTDESGRLLKSRDCGQDLETLAVTNPSPFTGLVEASDGSLVLSGARGMTRQAVKSQEAKP